MNNTNQKDLKDLFSQVRKSGVASSSQLDRVIDLGEPERTKYFSNKIKLSSHRDLVRIAKLEQRTIATILERAIETYKRHYNKLL